MSTDLLIPLVRELAAALTARGVMMATAESCTGGLIAATCTEVSGSSAWFDRGVVTYSNEAKCDLLGVPMALIQQHGAVSEPVARAMAEGMLRHSRAQCAVAVTGVAGPTGGTPDKPVGTVWVAWCTEDRQGRPQTHAERLGLTGDRASIRLGTVQAALQGLRRWAVDLR
jgi:nicotinamide-nucleotide amidase